MTNSVFLQFTNKYNCMYTCTMCTYICQAKENSHVCLGFVLIVLVDPFGLRQLNGKTCESINHFLPHWVGRLFGDDWWLRGHLCHRLWVVYSINFTGPDYYLQNFVFCPFGRSSLVTLPTHIWPVHLLCDLQPRLVTPSSCWSPQHFWCSFLHIRETTKIWFSFVNCALFAKPTINSFGFGNQALFCANFLRFLNSSFLYFDRSPSISTYALFHATQGINRSTESIWSFEWSKLTSCHLVLWLLIKLVLRLADGNILTDSNSHAKTSRNAGFFSQTEPVNLGCWKSEKS